LQRTLLLNLLLKNQQTYVKKLVLSVCTKSKTGDALLVFAKDNPGYTKSNFESEQLSLSLLPSRHFLIPLEQTADYDLYMNAKK
jgi:hypothetical protein